MSKETGFIGEKEALGNVEEEAVNRIYGRILRGSSEENFETFSDNPERKVVFFIPESELNKLEQIENDYQKLRIIGWSDEEIEKCIKGNNVLKLVTFPADSEFAKPATWDNLIEVICQAYPDLAEKINNQSERLKNVTYEEIFRNEAASKKIAMTPGRYASSSGSLIETRMFLHNTINVNGQFTGNGYTMTSDGKRGVLELVGLNRKLSEIPGIIQRDLKVSPFVGVR